MNKPSARSMPAQPSAQPQTAATYEAPRVSDLGAWQAVTLIYSVPFNGSPTMNDSGVPSFGVWNNKF
jgi:hypothetical protein